MPAYLGGSDRIGLKWVAGYEQNYAKGLPYIYGVMIERPGDRPPGRTARRQLDHRDAYARCLRGHDATRSR